MKRLLLIGLLLLGSAMPAKAAVANVQLCSGTWSTGTTWNTSCTVTTGNLLAVAVILWGNNSTTTVSSTGVADGTNTYTNIHVCQGSVGGVNVMVRTFYAKNVTGGALTITTTASGAGTSVERAITIVHEISGADPTSPLDQQICQATDTDPGTGADGMTSTAVLPTTDGQYIFGAATQYALVTLVKGTGFTNGVITASNGRASEYLIQGSAASVAATFTTPDGTASYRAGVVTFKAAASGGCKALMLGVC